ncbi:hypothetical protein [Sorangium sp. So ce233]|uniref:hypothetical protein n=1 Tax=Sorangium sp. So ce233 TaxID=3133290 RepID=UPI003F5EB4BF
MRPLTDAMQALVRVLRAKPAGVELSGRDITTARFLANRKLATRVRRLATQRTMNGGWLRREVWRLTERGRALAAGGLSRAQSTRTSRAPSGRRPPRRAARAGWRAC